jgi:hypothetical protein
MGKPRSQIKLTIDLSQHNDKNNYYHNFKIRLNGQPRTRSRSRIGLTINVGQRKDKNGFKTCPVDWPRENPSHELGWSTQVQDDVRIKMVIIINL